METLTSYSSLSHELFLLDVAIGWALLRNIARTTIYIIRLFVGYGYI